MRLPVPPNAHIVFLFVMWSIQPWCQLFAQFLTVAMRWQFWCPLYFTDLVMLWRDVARPGANVVLSYGIFMYTLQVDSTDRHRDRPAAGAETLGSLLIYCLTNRVNTSLRSQHGETLVVVQKRSCFCFQVKSTHGDASRRNKECWFHHLCPF